MFVLPPKSSKVELWRGLAGFFGESCSVLGVDGASCARLGHTLGPPWSVRGRLGGVLAVSLGVLGVSWKGFGRSWKLSGAILVVFWVIFLSA